ncbi:MAG TPA: thiamine pyrophosphate-binding protein [Burkholderiales bacterium]|nr:thiamine pyrophosphate-binding protein [Burkholderiales bacterium]
MEAKKAGGAEALLKVLRRAGVERIFASPGSEWSPLYEALAAPHGPGEIPDYLSTRHEETAVAMASGYAKITGKLPAVVIHTTVGALHAAMAMRAALHERVPMVVLAGESIAFGEAPGHDPGHQWLRLLADVGGPAALVERCVKFSHGANAAALLPRVIERACQLAAAEPQGPVFVSVPMEFLFEEVALGEHAAVAHVPAPQAPLETIERIAEELSKAKAPVIVSEELGRRPRAVEHLVAIAELLAAPVLETWNISYANFPRTHPLYAGAGGTDLAAEYVRESDCVALVETVVPWHPPSALPRPGTKLIALGGDPLQSHLVMAGARADLIAAGDVESALALLRQRLAQRVPSGTRNAAIERWRTRHEERRRAQREEARVLAERKPIDTRWVAVELDEVLPADAIVVSETITHRRPLHRYLSHVGPGRFFEGCYGGLGTGTGTALGAKVAMRDRPVVLLTGDGSFNYNPVLSALGASQEHALPILIVVFNNFGYLSQKRGVPTHFPDGWAVKSKRFAGTSIAPSPDYAGLAPLFGGYGERVEEPRDVRPALERGLAAIADGRLAILDVRLEPTNA